MIRYLFLFFIILHGAIHLLGFLKAFKAGRIEQLTMEISKFAGIVWLIATLFFLFSGVAYMLHINWWVFVLIASTVLSQILIIRYWKDAKFGTVANIIMLIVVILYTNFGIYL